MNTTTAPLSTTTAPLSARDPRPAGAAPRNGTLAWAALALVAVVALALVLATIALRAHADQRRDIMTQMTALEVAAAAQNTLVWRAMTHSMAGESHGFNRIRGQEQRQRGEIFQRLNRLRELEQSGEDWNTRLGFEPAPQLLNDLVDSTAHFVAGVQGSFGQMNLSRERMRNQMRERLEHWDMNHGYFETALDAVRSRNEQIAIASARIADRVTAAAAAITLLASLLFVASLARVRARRSRELQEERLQTVAASESRFRGLVQHSSDLIMVAQADGSVRYATPSAEQVAAAIDVMSLLGRERSEVEVRDAGGRTRVFDIRSTDLSENPDIGGIVLNGRDVTEAKALEAQLRHQALHDPLTGLANRRSFTAQFDTLTEPQRRSRFVLFIDLDGFKLVNDSWGHTVGDQLLVHVASRIQTCLSAGDLLARQGGDEFLVLCASADVAERIQAVLAAPFEIGHPNGIGPAAAKGAKGSEIFVSASIGIVANLAGIDAEQAAQRADIAMYKAKEAGKACAIAFSEEMLEGAPERLALESDFRRALERREFAVVYQPKVGLQSGITESLEALVRWIHPTRGFVGPDEFIPFAEESGLVHELGRQVLEQACRDAVRWQAFGVVVAVNLSPIQFRNPGLVDEVRASLQSSGLDARYLELEITESAVLGDVQNTIRVMRELKSLGIRLAIDDFGTGYSNLAHLKHFDVDVLKIDQAFIRGDGRGPVDKLSDGAIVQAVIGMAKAFDLHVVAEGVESSNHALELKSLGADLGQGYFFSKPIAGEGIDAFIEAEIADGRRKPQVTAH